MDKMGTMPFGAMIDAMEQIIVLVLPVMGPLKVQN